MYNAMAQDANVVPTVNRHCSRATFFEWNQFFSGLGSNFFVISKTIDSDDFPESRSIINLVNLDFKLNSDDV